jgi:polyphenol oxidase
VSPLLSLDSLPGIEYEFGDRHTTPPPDVVIVHQVHSACVISNRGRPARRDPGDALIENTPGTAIGVKTADCVPILLADPVQRAVAAVHAGWRGTAASIVHAAIRAMGMEFGTRPEDLHAAIGPSIGACCYEVGPDVVREFGVHAPGRVHLDLRAMNAKQLEAAGVLPANIAVSEECTKCRPEKYHSFRHDGEAAGRMISWIRIRA